jgi:hypothetical protein
LDHLHGAGGDGHGGVLATRGVFAKGVAMKNKLLAVASLTLMAIGGMTLVLLGSPGKESFVPNGASEVEDLGGGWYKFKLDDQQFLYNESRHLISPYQKGCNDGH